MASPHAQASTCSRTSYAASGASRVMWFRIATRFATLPQIIVTVQRRHKARLFQSSEAWTTNASLLLQDLASPSKRPTSMQCSRDTCLKAHSTPHSSAFSPVSYTHLRAHETDSYLVCRLLLEKKKTT